MGISNGTWLSSLALGAALSTSTVAAAPAKPGYAMGVCQTVDNSSDDSREEIQPTYDAGSYIFKYQNKRNSLLKKYTANKYSFEKAKTKILAAPKHGKLEWDGPFNSGISAAKEGWHVYVANKGFSDKDTFVIQAEKYEVKINIHYTVMVLDNGDNDVGDCDPPEWKISQIDAVGDHDKQLACTSFTPSPFDDSALSQPDTPLSLGSDALPLMIAHGTHYQRERYQ